MTRRMGRAAVLGVAVLWLGAWLLPVPAVEAHRPATQTPGPSPIALATSVASAAPVTALPPSLRAEPPVGLSPWLAGGALAAAIALTALGRSREARRCALTLLVVSFAAEAGVHAVHHLNDPRGAADCYALSLGQQLHASAPEAPAIEAPAAPVASVVPAITPAAFGVPRRPDRGRAPPTLPA